MFLLQIVAVLFFFAVASAAPKPQFITGVYPSVYSTGYAPLSYYSRAYAPLAYSSSVYHTVPSVYGLGSYGVGSYGLGSLGYSTYI